MMKFYNTYINIKGKRFIFRQTHIWCPLWCKLWCLQYNKSLYETQDNKKG